MPAGNIARPSGDVRLRPLAAGQCISTALVGVAPYCAHGHTTDEARVSEDELLPARCEDHRGSRWPQTA